MDELEDKIKYKLENFEGPLDLLLHLIKEAKMDIQSVRLSEITEQYLDYIKDMGSLDMEKASEFIDVAATLIEIKSKSLLPKPEEPEEEDTSEADLIKRLEMYKLFKETSEAIKPLENNDRFYKEADKSVGEAKIVLTDFNFDKLIEAFSKVLFRVENKQANVVPREITKDRFTVKEKIHNIKEVLTERKAVRFTELFDADYSKIEIITTFMALLELLKMQKIRAKQDEMFADIDITINEENFYKGGDEELDKSLEGVE